MYQRITIVGNLGKSPDLRFRPNGEAVTNFPVAVSERWTDNTGQQKEKTTWFRVVVWGKQAETCNQWLDKGSKVLVEGTLVADEGGSPKAYMRKDGTPGASFELSATTVRFLSTKPKDNAVTEIGDSADYPVSEEPLPF